MYLEHANLTVTDLGRSIAFYRDLFDFEVRWQGTDSAGRPAAHIGDERFYLAFFEAARPGRAVKDYSVAGLNHIGFVVDDLDGTRRRLEELGAEVHLEGDYEPGRRIYFHDPDGVEIELVEYGDSAI